MTAEADRERPPRRSTQAKAETSPNSPPTAIYRKEERDRITNLVQRKAVAERLVDEQQRQFDAALAAERPGDAAVTAAAASFGGAARVAQARPTRRGPGRHRAAKADLAKARSASTTPGSSLPTMVWSRSAASTTATSSARPPMADDPRPRGRPDQPDARGILVPDLDVPFVDRGDPATLRVDALQGQVFRGKVARFANSENEQKLMRTEVDLPNPDNLLRDGMYGTATIEVEPPSQNLRIPSTCLIEQTGQGQGAVYVVRDGKAHRQPVQVGLDDGREVEIVGGLTPEDQVIVRYNGTIADGLAVRAEAVEDHVGRQNSLTTPRHRHRIRSADYRWIPSIGKDASSGRIVGSNAATICAGEAFPSRSINRSHSARGRT